MVSQSRSPPLSLLAECSPEVGEGVPGPGEDQAVAHLPGRAGGVVVEGCPEDPLHLHVVTQHRRRGEHGVEHLARHLRHCVVHPGGRG